MKLVIAGTVATGSIAGWALAPWSSGRFRTPFLPE